LYSSVCSPSPAPLPKLALISEFPANYTGPTANLTAINEKNDTCVEAPSARYNMDNVTLVSPGLGLCNKDGSMPPGTYRFNQAPPPGTEFKGWECYEIIGSNAIGPIAVGMTPVVNLNGTQSVTCKAIYELTPR
jgi:hypothetical protein